MTRNLTLDVLTLDGSKQGTLALPAALFGLPVRADLLARAVQYQLQGRRAGLANTKTRGEIDRTKKKAYGQKKTGNARHGARSPSLFVGGGVTFGPRPRDFSLNLPKKVRVLALKTALSSKLAANQIVVLHDTAAATGKTKQLNAQLTKLAALNATFLVDSLDANFDLASRNLPHVKVLPTSGANVYDILHHEKLVLTPAAVAMLSARLSAEDSAEAAPKAAKVAKAKAAAPKAEAAQAPKPKAEAKASKAKVAQAPKAKTAAAKPKPAKAKAE